jgi:XTP/dITP diphosphohydrolase
MQLLLATRNRHKLKEISAILADLNLDVQSAADIAGVSVIKEDGATLQDNAVKKAVETAKIAKMLTLADDTGLEVDALNGEPGVRSARFAGEEATYGRRHLQRRDPRRRTRRRRFRLRPALHPGRTSQIFR